MSQEPPFDSRGDRDLLACFVADGRQEAFAALVRRHGDMVLRVCRARLGNAADAEDAAQAVFLTLARRASSLTRHETLAGWLYRVAWYVAGNAARARLTRLRHEQEAARMGPPANNPASDLPIPPEALYAGLFALAEKYRLPLILHHLQGKTESETAALLGISVSAASVRLARGRQKLRNQLVRLGAVSTVALTAALSAPASAVPAVFVTTATQTAASALAGQALTGSILSLSQGAIHMLFMAKMKLVAMVTAAVLLVGGAGVTTYEAVARAVNRDPDREAHAAKLEDLPAILKHMTLDERMLYLKGYAQQFKPRDGVAVQRSANGAVEVAVAAENTSIKLWRPTGTVLSVVVAGDGVTSNLQARSGGEVHLAAMPPSGDVYALGGDGSPVGWAGGGAGGGVLAGTKPCYDPPFDRFQDVDMNKANPRKGGGRGIAVAFFAANPAPAEAPAQAPTPGEVTLRGQVFTQTGSNRLCDPDVYPLVMNVKTPRRVEMYFLKASDLTRQFAREVAAKGAMQVVVVGKVAKEGIYDAVTVSRIEVADAATQPAARAAAAEEMPMAEMVKGEKVLVKFWHYPLVDHPNSPSDDEIAAGRKKIGDKIAQALKAANVEAVRFLWGQDGKEGSDRSSYSAMMLLDCKGARPEKALADVPHRVVGIVFKDGAYERALPVETESKWLITARKGQVPARYAFYSRGGSAVADLRQGQQDVERFGKMAELRVDAIPPLPGATGGGWSAKLTPAPGHTLLEVFILTGAGFQLIDPPTSRPAAPPPANAALMEKATLAVVARVTPPPPGALGALGPRHTRFARLTVISVLKGDGVKAGDVISIAYDDRDALPEGQFRAYLVSEQLQVRGASRGITSSANRHRVRDTLARRKAWIEPRARTVGQVRVFNGAGAGREDARGPHCRITAPVPFSAHGRV